MPSTVCLQTTQSERACAHAHGLQGVCGTGTLENLGLRLLNRWGGISVPSSPGQFHQYQGGLALANQPGFPEKHLWLRTQSGFPVGSP